MFNSICFYILVKDSALYVKFCKILSQGVCTNSLFIIHYSETGRMLQRLAKLFRLTSD